MMLHTGRYCIVHISERMRTNKKEERTEEKEEKLFLRDKVVSSWVEKSRKVQVKKRGYERMSGRG